MQNDVNRLAKNVNRGRLFRNIALLACITLSLIITFSYGLLEIASFNAMTIKTKGDDNSPSLVLSAKKDFASETNQLVAAIPGQISDYTYKILNAAAGGDLSTLDAGHEGVHHGDNYAAYTFYLKNNSSVQYNFSAGMQITNATNGIEDCIRLMVFEDGNYRVFAKRNLDGTPASLYDGDDYAGLNPSRNTSSFLTNEVVFLEKIPNFAPNQVKRYTVVIWIEGKDPECVDSVIGGQIKVEMNFEVEEY